MIERELDIATRDGAMNTWTVRPNDGEPLPVVLMMMDAPGVRESLREIGRRIAQSGYFVLLPNLYYRTVREFVLGPTRDHPDAEANLKKLFAMVGSISNDRVAADVGAVLDTLPALAGARPGKVGLVGYCMSGAFVTVAAAKHADRIACFASYYGTRLITDGPDSPHLLLGDITAEGYYAFAEHDTYVPLEQVAAFERMLAAAPFPSRTEIEPGTHHGYAFTDRGNYHRAASERHYERMLALYRRHLG
ncbi:MAG: dienelactone hydrolase family protein [Reyranella sp.]|uniref:dienelactone hydrolase family protein n=1 Tax=Reyranella sp. TaxID=1929291 RepID=UPI003D0FD1D3